VPGGGGDKKVEKDKKKGGAHDEPVAFGQPLEKLLQKPDSKKSVRSGKGMTLSYIPAVVSDCIRFLDQPQRLSLEGLFRLSPAKDDFDRIRALWKGMAEPLDLESHTSDPHAVAAVLKSFFNSLPEPVMTYAISEQIFALSACLMSAAKLLTLLIVFVCRGHGETAGGRSEGPNREASDSEQDDSGVPLCVSTARDRV
jgi:hypothetical protein